MISALRAWTGRWDAAGRGARALRAFLSAMVGAPNYDRYLDHVRRAHPEGPPLSRDDFCRRQLERRYNRVGGRCC